VKNDMSRGLGQEPLDPRNWADDPRISAFALGELEGAERDAVARFIAEHDEVRAFVDEVRGAAHELEEALAHESNAEEVSLTALQRSLVTANARSRDASDRNRIWRRSLGVYGGMAAAAAVVGTVSVLLLQNSREFEFGYSVSGKASAPGMSASGAPAYERSFSQGRVTSAPKGYVADNEAEVALGAPATPAGEEPRGLGYLVDDADPPAAAEQRDESEAMVEGEEVLEEVVPDVPSREGYDRIVDNSFVPTSLDRLSTFSIDVDTASYTNVRRMLQSGSAVPPDAVRIEELVNYFTYDYEAPAPDAEHPFAVHVDVTAAPWKPEHRLVRIGLKARDIDLAQRPKSNLVFLLDVSGSMDEPNKLPLVKRAMALLVEQLGENDRVAIVVYASAQGLALPSTSGEAREAILQAIERLDAGGSTNGGAGIQLAYATAREHFVTGGLNRVILCTDGDFNVGVSSDGDLERLIEKEAKSGVFLTVLGFGSGNWQDAKMEKLSNRGNGNFAYIDSVLEAQKVLVEQLGGTLATVAKDVKIQVEFNPAEVQAARLIGYENRVLAHQDFLDDTKDAGEIGAGHTVTALYEVIPTGVPYEAPAMPEPRYGARPVPSAGVASGELLTVSLRYKLPEGDTSTGFEVPVKDGGKSFDEASDDTRFAAAVAAFGMVLRGSQHVGGADLMDVSSWALEATGEDRGGYRAGFLDLVLRARHARPR
jgi:Ca-activated chloride channel family protein